MNPDDPKVKRALRMGKTRKQQAAMLGVSSRTAQRLARGTVPPFRGINADREPPPATDKHGRKIDVGDIIKYPSQRGGSMRNEARVIEILPPYRDGEPYRPFRLRVQSDADCRISVIRAVERVETV